MRPNSFRQSIVRNLMATVIVFGQVAPAFADTPYLRMGRGDGIVGGVDTPAPGENDEPTGDLLIEIPPQVRARIGVNAAIPFVAQGATDPTDWSSVGEDLPAGLSFDPDTASIKGTPTTIGKTGGLMVKATDSIGLVGFTRSFAIDVRPQPTVTLPLSQYSTTTGNSFSIPTPQTTEVWGSNSWTLTGVLPYGLKQDPATGAISGTPIQAGVFADLAATVTDGDGASGTSAPFVINVASGNALVGYQNNYRTRAGSQFHSGQPSMNGAEGAVSYEVVEGDLPAGVVISSSTGLISGKPESAGTFDGIYVQAVDAHTLAKSAFGPISIEVIGPPTVTMGDVFRRQGEDFKESVTVSNFIGDPSLEIIEGSLPNGVSLLSDGRLNGSSEITGSSTGIVIEATDGDDGVQGRSEPFSVNIWERLQVIKPGVATAYVGSPYSIGAPGIRGQRGEVSWAVTGEVPPGLEVDPASAEISGVPSEDGYFTIRYVGTDSADSATAASQPVTIRVLESDDAEKFAFIGDPSEYVGVAGTRLVTPTPSVRGNQGSVSYDIYSGELPAWATFNGSTGQIQGTPAVPGQSAPLVLRARDASGREAWSQPFTINIQSGSAEDLTFEPMGPTFRSVPDTFLSTGRPTVTGGQGALVFKLVGGTLPSWLSFNAATGEIYGTAPAPAYVKGLRLQAFDSANARTVNSNVFDISVRPAGDNTVLTVEGIARSYSGRALQPFAFSQPVVHGNDNPVLFSIASGDQPEWASLDIETGIISGTPGAPELTRDMSLRVLDELTGETALSSPFSIEIDSPYPVSAQITPNLVADYNTPFSVTPTVSNDRGKLTWKVGTGTLPAWATLDTATGEISGTPDSLEAVTGISLLVSDSYGTASTGMFTIQVRGPGDISADTISDAFFGEVGQPFTTATPKVNRNVGAVTWTLDSDPLPTWATLDPATGVVTGTPPSTQSITGVTLRATDSRNASTRPRAFSITIRQSSLAVNPAAAAFKARLQANLSTPARTTTGASGLVTWSRVAGELPIWATLDPSTGVIAGVAITAGTWSGIVLRATDAASKTAISKPFSIQVGETTPTANAPSVISAQVGRPLSVTPSSAGLLGNPTWRLMSGTLPAWAKIDAATGRITGTPTAVGTFGDIVLAVRDSFDNKDGVTPPFSIEVSASGPYFEIADLYARVGTPFRYVPTPENTQGTVRWSLSEGTLPTWASVDGATGVISGLPTAVSTASNLRISIADDAGSWVGSSFVLRSLPEMSATVNQSDLTVRPWGEILTATPSVTGLRGQAAWSIEGELPTGMTLDSGRGTISGSSLSAGVYPVKLVVKDSLDGATAVAGQFSITVKDLPKIAANALYEGRVGYDFEATPSVSNTSGIVAWGVTAGALPAGLVIDPSTGVISGIPTTPGAIGPVKLMAVDSLGAVATSEDITFSIATRMQVEVSETLIGARTGKNFASKAPRVSGQQGSVTWIKGSGTTPEWASLNPDTGVLSGSPTVPGTYNYSLQANDAAGNNATGPSITMIVADRPQISVQSVTTRVNATLTVTPSVLGAIGGQSFSLLGTLPSWAKFNADTGAISGIPNETGVFEGLSIKVTDGEGASATTQPFSISVTKGLEVAWSAVDTEIRVGHGVNMPAPVVVGKTGNITWTLDDGVLPNGISVNKATGVVSGSASAAGSYTVALRATDSTDVAYAVTSPIVLTVVGYPTIAVDMSYRGHATEPFPPITPVAGSLRGDDLAWSVYDGRLPAWATLDESTGAISGTPSGSGKTSGIRLQVIDRLDNAVGYSKPFSIEVIGELAVVNMATEYSARFGFPFNQAVPIAENGIGELTWRLVAGSLPSWASLDEKTGIISGTPDTTDGAAGLRLQVTDQTGVTAQSVIFSLDVFTAPVATLEPASIILRVGAASTIQPEGYGTVGARTWTVKGTVPAGLSLNKALGTLSGTPTTPIVSDLILRLTDSYDEGFAETPVRITVLPAFTMSGADEDIPVRAGDFMESQPIEVFGASSQYSGTMTSSGNLPVGVTFTPSTGRLSGVVNGNHVPGEYPVTITATDPVDLAKAVRKVMIRIIGKLTATAPLTAYARSGQVVVATAPTISGNIGTPTWSLAGATLPAGITIDPISGKLTGSAVVTTATTIPGIKVKATDGANEVVSANATTLTLQTPLSITGADGVFGTRGQLITLDLTASGALGTIGWSANGLPEGLYISPTGTGQKTTGRISGKPTESGTFEVTVVALDSLDKVVATKVVSIEIGAIPVIGMANISGTVGTPLEASPVIQDAGDGTVSYTLTHKAQAGSSTPGAAKLPAGLSFDPATGRISGTPLASLDQTKNTYPVFEIQGKVTYLVNGATTQVTTNLVQFKLNIAKLLPTLTVPTITGTRGESLSFQVPQPGNVFGTVSYWITSFKANGLQNGAIRKEGLDGGGYNGAFPTGLGFDGATGRFYSTPTIAWNDTGYFVITVVDTRTVNGVTDVVQSNSAPFKIVIDDWAKPTVSMASVSGIVGTKVTDEKPVVENVMGTPTYRIKIYRPTGSLQASRDAIGPTLDLPYFPYGMTFDDLTGTIGGTPLRSFTEGYTFAIELKDRRTIGGVVTDVVVESNRFTLRVEPGGD